MNRRQGHAGGRRALRYYSVWPKTADEEVGLYCNRCQSVVPLPDGATLFDLLAAAEAHEATPE
jgi:hypothetical protein